MSYCRQSADCDLYLYHDGERFVFTGPTGDRTCDRAEEALGICVLLLQRGYKVEFPAITRLAREIHEAIHTPGQPSQDVEPLSTAAMPGPVSTSSTAHRHALSMEAQSHGRDRGALVEIGTDVAPPDGSASHDEILHEDQAWAHLARQLAMAHGADPAPLPMAAVTGETLGAERLEACLEKDLQALPAALDGTGDPRFIQVLADWGHDLDALDLRLVCVQRPGTMFILDPESRARLEQQALTATAQAHPLPMGPGVERPRL